MSQLPIIHIVHHIDTEGPLHEPISEIFKRLETTLNVKIELEATPSNLEIIREGNYFEDEELNVIIKRILDPQLVNFKSSWTEVDEMLMRMLSESYRNKFQDSFGGGWIYSWHIICHVGFNSNERRRDLGYLNIFNHYEEILKETNSKQDKLYWHFHPISFFKEAHISATSYLNSMDVLNQVISRRLIEKKWFPNVNRAGFHTVRPDSNWFLEQWIPFDASNQGIDEDNSTQVDASFGRFGDWSGAPDDWSVYSPDLYDWRKKGNLKRKISRVLNLKTRFRNISEQEIRNAFELASNTNDDVYLGVTNHDFREMSSEIEPFYEDLKKVAEEYKGKVNFKFSNAVDAFNAVLKNSESEIKENGVEIDCSFEKNVLKVDVKNGEIWGAQPYLAIKTNMNDYLHDNFDFGADSKVFYYTFDRITIELDKIQEITVATNDKFGGNSIVSFKIKNGEVVEKLVQQGNKI